MSNVEQWEHDEQLAMENEQFANYAKQKPHLYGGCDEITTLREQLAALTKERDELKTVPMKYRRMQFNAELQDEVTQLQKQLAVLAEQNEKQRAFLEFAWKDIPMNEYAFEILEHVMNLPDLATPVLNRIRAEAMEEENEAIIAAANALENIASTSSSTRIRRVANAALTAIRARRKACCEKS